MFYKFELAIWLLGPCTVFPGLSCAMSKLSVLLARRHKGSSRLQADTAVGAILEMAGFGAASHLSLLFRFLRASSPPALKIMKNSWVLV